MSEITVKQIHDFIAYCEKMIAANNDCGDPAPSQLVFGKHLATEFLTKQEEIEGLNNSLVNCNNAGAQLNSQVEGLEAQVRDLKSKLEEDDGK